MPGGAVAVTSGTDLERAVAELGNRIGLDVRRQVRVGRRLWGAERSIDVVVSRSASNKSLGIECKWQGVGGSAEEKIPATIQDIEAWPIAGLVVFAGQGFSTNMTSYLHSTGKAVSFDDLEGWLRLFFGLAEPIAGIKDTDL
jgi:hypothetical protein